MSNIIGQYERVLLFCAQCTIFWWPANRNTAELSHSGAVAYHSSSEAAARAERRPAATGRRTPAAELAARTPQPYQCRAKGDQRGANMM